MNQSPKTQTPSFDLTGRELGDYQVLRRLGRGGMADVYLARQTSLNRKIALKILKPELAGDDSYVQRFRQEAQAAANLVQANIVQIYEVGECEGFYFIAQEYIQGRNLQQYLARHGAVEPVMAVNVLRQCAMAFQKAEEGEFNVIHRDIKPENIMLSTKGEVKITDFGLARINNNSEKQALTQIGVTMGTPLYMSPEQVEGGTIDHRSDIYSLGVTAYHMLAGNPPFEGDNALAIAVQHVKDTPVPLEQLRPDVPPELCEIICQMMAKKREDRPADAKQLLKALRKVKVDLDDDWEMIIEKLSVAETERFGDTTGTWSQSKLAATRQLQAVIKGNAQSWYRSSATLTLLALLSIAGVIGGVVFANQTIPESLLSIGTVDASEIPRKASAGEQYEAARWAPTDVREEYWKSVLQHFPLDGVPDKDQNKTQLAHRKAKARLAELYLTQARFDEALEIFNEFIGYEVLAEDFRVTGYAGQAIVFHNRAASDFANGMVEKTDRIREAITSVGSKQNLLNEFMNSLFEGAKQSVDSESQPDDEIQDTRGENRRLIQFVRPPVNS